MPGMGISGRSPIVRAVPAAVVPTLVAALLCVVVPAGAAAPKARHAERLLQVPHGVVRFSPNGDGSQDRTQFSYRPSQRAAVKVTVRDARGHVVRTANLGKQRRGWHRWNWNGRNHNGAYVRDGAYRVSFTATTSRHGKQLRDSDTTRAVARTRFDRSPNGIVFAPGVYLDRDAIYRDTTYFKDEFSWNGAFYRTSMQGSFGSRGASRITGPDGGVVYERGDRYHGDNQDSTWDGTDEDGVRVPAGTYSLVNTWTDLYGNHLSVTKPLVVRDGSRVEQHHSITVTPAEARVGTATEPFEFLAGSHKVGTYLTYACPPRASDRFPAGSLSFALYDPRCTVSDDSFKVTLPATLDLTFDTVTLTAVGGPTTAGGEGSAALTLTQPAPVWATTGAGDEANTVLETHRTWQPDTDQVTWTVSRTSGGYDFKSFTVDIYHYAPPA
jgi:flagellar hook assembly protein FlgD